jgi:hypothetical protein
VLPATIALGQNYVIVTVDMDALTPGLQTTIDIPAGTTRVDDVAVYIYSPSGRNSLFGIGFIGGIDRGIAFGHMPSNTHAGRVTRMTARVGEPVNPANFGIVWGDGAIMKGFVGPEVQYLETGAQQPAPFPTAPLRPVFTADIELHSAQRGDVFDFYLLDFVAVWSPGHGAFTTINVLNTLDTGGDAIPDGTRTAYGVDPDTPIPVPPASFLVDFIDGAPATITIAACPADLNGDGVIDLADLGILLADFGCTAPGPCPGDVNGDGDTDLADLGILLAEFGSACP